MAKTCPTDLVSDGEILTQLREITTQVPRAGVLLQSVRRGSLSVRDACYFLLLEALEKRRRSSGPVASQSQPAYGP